MMIPKPTVGDTSWFTQDRFGLFIHWGLYALPARHEWVKHIEQIPDAVYDTYFRHFDPDLYDPDLWAEAASKAGMKYFVVTTKHHEGFCLWDSALTDYKATRTPAGRRWSMDSWHKDSFAMDTKSFFSCADLRTHPKRRRGTGTG